MNRKTSKQMNGYLRGILKANTKKKLGYMIFLVKANWINMLHYQCQYKSYLEALFKLESQIENPSDKI